MTEPSPGPARFLPPGSDPTEASDGGAVTVRVLAGAARRLTARLLDYLVLAVLVMTLLPLAMVAEALGRYDGMELAVALTVGAGSVVVVFGGWAFLRIGRVRLWGCTVGQRIAGVRVVASDGVSDPSWRQAWSRARPTWGDKPSSTAMPWDDYFAWKGSAARRSSAGQCLHDRNADTFVVAVEDLSKETTRRIVHGVLLAVAVAAIAAAAGLEAVQDSDDRGSPTRTVPAPAASTPPDERSGLDPADRASMDPVSLCVDVFVIDERGERVLLEPPTAGADLAGHERMRTLLWGSAAVRDLGARHLPVLADGDLWVVPEQVEDFLSECELVRAHLPAVAAGTGKREDYIAYRLGNIIEAARRARDLGGGVVIW